MKIALTEKKMLTMADRFQEALGASYVTDEGTHIGARKSFGYLIIVASQYFQASENN